MSELKKLLEGVKVDWIYLGEVAELKRGTTITAKSKSDGDIPVISGGQKPAYYNDKFNRENETLTIAGSGAYAGFVSYWNEPIFVADAFSIKPSKDLLNTLYIYHILKSKQDMIYKLKKGVGVPHVYPKDLGKFLIPIPCPDNPEKSVKIQEEIVRFLDRLSEETNQLTAALQKELQLHQKRYDFYREELFKFEGKEVEWKSLGEVSKLITKGTTPKKYSECGISFIKTEAFSGSNIILKKLSFIDEETHEKELKRSMLEENDILITIAGATIGKCAIVPKEVLPANTNQALAIIRLMDVVDVKFIFHLLKSGLMKKYIELNSKGSAQPNLNLKQLNDFVIPFTSLVEQSRIVKILDDLDSKTQEITAAINTEIWLRNKQYEYYRDSLLSFQSLETVAEAVQ